MGASEKLSENIPEKFQHPLFGLPGVDTVTLWRPVTAFQTPLRAGWGGTGLVGSAGRSYQGLKFVRNVGGASFTFWTDGEEMTSGRLSVQFSLPKLLNGSNASPYVPGVALAKDFARLDGLLMAHIGDGYGRPSSWGDDGPPVATNRSPRHGGLSRLDVACDIDLGSGEVLRRVLKRLEHRRLPRSRAVTDSFGGLTVRWAGSSRQFTAYDKREEVRRRENVVAPDLGAGVLRVEARVMHSRDVSRIVGPVTGGRPSLSATCARNVFPDVAKVVCGPSVSHVSQIVDAVVSGRSFPDLQALIAEMGPRRAATVLGLHVMHQLHGSEWLRSAFGDDGNYYRTRKVLAERGLALGGFNVLVEGAGGQSNGD